MNKQERKQHVLRKKQEAQLEKTFDHAYIGRMNCTLVPNFKRRTNESEFQRVMKYKKPTRQKIYNMEGFEAKFGMH